MMVTRSFKTESIVDILKTVDEMVMDTINRRGNEMILYIDTGIATNKIISNVRDVLEGAEFGVTVMVNKRNVEIRAFKG